MTASGAHATVLTVAGYQLSVKRTFALICRIEERFGPIRELSERLGGARLTARELYDLYWLLLADIDPPVPQTMIEHHVMHAGLACCIREIAPLIEAFFVGEERFMKRVAEQAGGSRPQATGAAASPGVNSSAPLPGSAGNPGNSGSPRSTSSLRPYQPASMKTNGLTAAE